MHELTHLEFYHKSKQIYSYYYIFFKSIYHAQDITNIQHLARKIFYFIPVLICIACIFVVVENF